MKIWFGEESGVSEELLALMEKAADAAAVTEGFTEEDLESMEVSVTFVSPGEIHSLNKEYRGVDRVTDVLSFPQFGSADEIGEEIDNVGFCMIGDVVICADKAAEQAEEYGHSYERELIYLFVHSILHLFGYDHMQEDEKKEMREREEEVMDLLGIPRR